MDSKLSAPHVSSIEMSNRRLSAHLQVLRNLPATSPMQAKLLGNSPLSTTTSATPAPHPQCRYQQLHGTPDTVLPCPALMQLPRPLRQVAALLSSNAGLLKAATAGSRARHSGLISQQEACRRIIARLSAMLWCNMDRMTLLRGRGYIYMSLPFSFITALASI
jgi:hypothetical protein